MTVLLFGMAVGCVLGCIIGAKCAAHILPVVDAAWAKIKARLAG